jgi:hypothetical protein
MKIYSKKEKEKPETLAGFILEISGNFPAKDIK